jgi:hypothetical protein
MKIVPHYFTPYITKTDGSFSLIDLNVFYDMDTWAPPGTGKEIGFGVTVLGFGFSVYVTWGNSPSYAPREDTNETA